MVGAPPSISGRHSVWLYFHHPGIPVTPSPPHRGRSGFWWGALLVLSAVLGAAWLADSMSDRGLITTPAMDPSTPSMPGMDHETMPGMSGSPSP